MPGLQCSHCFDKPINKPTNKPINKPTNNSSANTSWCWVVGMQMYQPAIVVHSVNSDLGAFGCLLAWCVIQSKCCAGRLTFHNRAMVLRSDTRCAWFRVFSKSIDSPAAALPQALPPRGKTFAQIVFLTLLSTSMKWSMLLCLSLQLCIISVS